MATPVEMPKLGNTVEECVLLEWHKGQGDEVQTGDVLAEIETDKTSFDLTAPAAGTLLELFFAAGDMVPVFTNVCVIGAAGESVDAFRPQPAAPPAAAAPSPAAPAAPYPPATVSAASAPTTTGPAKLTPAAAAGTDGTDGGVAAAGRNGAGSAATTHQAAPAGPLSPRARRFAAEHGLKPAPMTGSGPGGRVLERDLRALLAAAPAVSALARELLEQGYEIRGPGTGLGGMVRSRDLAEPPVQFSGIRARIAQRMRESLTTTAQYTMNASADARGLLAMRKAIKATTGAPDITINDLVVFCTILAVREVPAVNAELVDGRLYQRRHINLGFACDTPRGLMVPVVRAADELTLTALSGAMKELAAQAVAGSLPPDDMSDATFTVSNLGGLGIESFTPVLNPPQVAILGVDAITLRAVRNREGGVDFVDHIGLSLTVDHQVVDGAPGARFLGVVAQKIAGVESLCSI